MSYINQDEMRMHKFEQSFLSQNKFQLHFWNLSQLFPVLFSFAILRHAYSGYSEGECIPSFYAPGFDPSEILRSYTVPTLYGKEPDANGCWFYSVNSTVPVSNTSEGLSSMSGFQCVLYGSQNKTWYYH